MGIVGLPNVGKSSFFNALTNSSAPAENFPFCTIEPEESRVAVPDARFDWLCDLHKPPSRIPAYLTVIDIAGLVKGAHEGQGLGNAFLANIKAVDGIFHLCRAFDDSEVIHVEGNLDPVRDLDIIHNELRLKDTEIIDKMVASRAAEVRRLGQGGCVTKKLEFETLLKVQKCLKDEKKDVRSHQDWTYSEIEFINSLMLLTAKPVVYLCNMSLKDYCQQSSNKWLPKIKQFIHDKYPGDVLIPFSGVLEQELSEIE